MRNKIFTKIIITTLLVAFLTFNVGKVTRVSAVGTTAAIAGTAFILTGAVYLSYVALTQGEMVLPAAENMHNWLGGIGRKVSQYPSGAAAYQDIYQGLLRDPTANVIDGVWTWTQDRIRDFVNDFSDTRIISDMVSYDGVVATDWIGTNGFTYSPVILANYIGGTSETDTFAYYESIGFTITQNTGPRVVKYTNDNTTYTFSNLAVNYQVRNYMTERGTYFMQYYDGNAWQTFNGYQYYSYSASRYGTDYYLVPHNYNPYYSIQLQMGNITTTNAVEYAIPMFPDNVIYDSVNDRDLPMVIPVGETQLPSWVDPDNNNRPIIPWVSIPQLPVNVNPPSGYVNPQWGFNLQDLLDKLENLAGQLIDIGAIASLINEFAGLHGDNYYLEYNDGDTNYYTYYQPTVFDNDTEYVTYNINVSEQEDIIPVDLNTISLYTQNRYLEQIKDSAIAGSSMLRDLAVFWHDVDPEVTYIVLGCCILVLIGAFTGKLGHS